MEQITSLKIQDDEAELGFANGRYLRSAFKREDSNVVGGRRLPGTDLLAWERMKGLGLIEVNSPLEKLGIKEITVHKSQDDVIWLQIRMTTGEMQSIGFKMSVI